MPNYKQEELVGNKWLRCHSIFIENAYDGRKYVKFHEEEVLVLPNTDPFFQSTITLITEYNPNSVIQVINPYTLQPTGNTFTHNDLYLMLFSAYMDAALKRDSDQANLTSATANT